MVERVLYTAAHAVDGSERVPLGGGATISRWLSEEWTRTKPFSLHVLGPLILTRDAPSGKDLVGFTEGRYAKFCREFERATTAEILKEDPRNTVVLSNDISEGPDFARLAHAGFRITTIYHVDVVAYIAAIYAHGWVRPETTVRWFERIRRFPLPDVLRLVWDKQRDSVRYSRKLVVPSQPMKQTLERCYPNDAPGKVEVVPWGSREAVETPDIEALRREYDVPPDAYVLLTLSRISPEKGQDQLLEALCEWEQSKEFPARPIVLFLCGEAAFMQGQRYMQRLKQLAGRLHRIKTFFPGHVSGSRKAAFFALADLYIFPSRHESYGLTLVEALGAGCPAICLRSDGASQVMDGGFGEVTSRDQLWQTIAAWLQNEAKRAAASRAAKAYAQQHRFEEAAKRVALIVASGLP